MSTTPTNERFLQQNVHRLPETGWTRFLEASARSNPDPSTLPMEIVAEAVLRARQALGEPTLEDTQLDHYLPEILRLTGEYLQAVTTTLRSLQTLRSQPPSTISYMGPDQALRAIGLRILANVGNTTIDELLFQQDSPKT